MAFGLLLVVVLILGHLLQNWFGDAGLLWLAAASGVTDVDAINLSLSRMSLGDLSPQIAVLGVVIAAASNNLAKAIMASAIGGYQSAIQVGVPLIVSGLAGLSVTWLWL